MSQKPISRSADLTRLRNEGYDLEIRSDHLLVKDVPYVAAGRIVKRGILVMPLKLAGDVTVKPENHVAHFIGEFPCRADGTQIDYHRERQATGAPSSARASRSITRSRRSRCRAAFTRTTTTR